MKLYQNLNKYDHKKKRQIIFSTLVIIICLFLSSCNNNSILANLSQNQANEVLAVLQKYNITAFKKGSKKDGYDVFVGSKDTDTALSIINQYQLPNQSEENLMSEMNGDSSVPSPEEQREKIILFQEQKLEQSIRLIAQVVNVRVNISYPFNNSYSLVAENVVPTASVLIIYSGDLDSNMFINQIKSLIKNSISNITYKNISVILSAQQPIQYPKYVKSTGNYYIYFIVIAIILILIGLFCYLLCFKKDERLITLLNKINVLKEKENAKKNKIKDEY